MRSFDLSAACGVASSSLRRKRQRKRESANPPRTFFRLGDTWVTITRTTGRAFSGKGATMQSAFGCGGRRCLLAVTVALGLWLPATADAACCYFSAQNADILQPAQKVFI